jgi:hypothetical protein
MRWGLGVVCLVAACSGQGVDLEITSEVSIDRVELFFANEYCYNDDGSQCEGVAWQTEQQRPPGEVYVMKGDENIVATQRFEGDRAVMHIEATPEFREPKVLAIIGFSGETAVSYAMLFGPRIPSNSAETWKIDLKYAGPAMPSFTTPPEPGERYERIRAWKRERVDHPEELSQCLAMQFWDESESEWDGVFIVPESDPDCDGRAIECDPLHANYNIGGGPTACVTTLQTFGEAPCVVGTALCEDGARETGDCLAATSPLTCAPQEVCAACEGDPALVTCAATALKSNTDVSGVECTFNGTDGGNTCGQDLSGAYSQISLPVGCSAVEVRPVTAPFMISASPDMATVATATIKVSTVSSAAGSCLIDLHWTDGTAQPGTSGVFVFIVTGINTLNTLALPVRITFGPAVAMCTTGSNEPDSCVANNALGTDSMLSCLRQ